MFLDARTLHSTRVFALFFYVIQTRVQCTYEWFDFRFVLSSVNSRWRTASQLYCQTVYFCNPWKPSDGLWSNGVGHVTNVTLFDNKTFFWKLKTNLQYMYIWCYALMIPKQISRQHITYLRWDILSMSLFCRVNASPRKKYASIVCTYVALIDF